MYKFGKFTQFICCDQSTILWDFSFLPKRKYKKNVASLYLFFFIENEVRNFPECENSINIWIECEPHVTWTHKLQVVFSENHPKYNNFYDAIESYAMILYVIT